MQTCDKKLHKHHWAAYTSKMSHTSLLQPSAALQQVQLEWKRLQESTPTTHSVTVAMSFR